MLCFGGVILYYHQLNYQMIINEAIIQLPDLVQSLKHEFRSISTFLIASILCMVAVLFGLGLVITHRVVGPILALKKRLLQLAQGKLKVRLRLRKNDEFKNLQSLFNSAMERIEESFEVIQHDQIEILNEIEEGNVEQAKLKLQKLIKNNPSTSELEDFNNKKPDPTPKEFDRAIA